MYNLYILNEVYTNGFYYDFLNIISVLAILCGVSVIVTKNPVVSVLFLIGLFFSMASYLMLLGMNFIGISYLLVYVGAVSILFLFILMLINVRISELVTDNNNSLILAGLIGIFITTPIYSKANSFNNIKGFTYSEKELGENMNTTRDTGPIDDLVTSLNNVYHSRVNEISFATSKSWDGALGEFPHITGVGSVIYTNYPIWLILTSIILLLSMVGAIIITVKK